jgi:hypothetical protein
MHGPNNPTITTLRAMWTSTSVEKKTVISAHGCAHLELVVG